MPSESVHPQPEAQLPEPEEEEEEEFPAELGPVSELQEPNAQVRRMVDRRLVSILKKKFEEIDSNLTIPEKYDVVGERLSKAKIGWYFYVKVKLGETFYQIKTYQNLIGSPSLINITETKTEEDEQIYFKSVCDAIAVKE